MKRRTAFLIGMMFELVAVFCIFIPPMLLRSTGTAITLETVPVDPYSVFRGQYVTLDYAVGMDVPQAQNDGKPVYVVLARNGELYERVSFGGTKPVLEPGQVCLRGSLTWTGIHFNDIGQYFVEEGKGMEIQQAQQTNHLLVDAKVSPNCHAVIDAVRIGDALTQEELEARNQRLNPGVMVPIDGMTPAEKPQAAPANE